MDFAKTILALDKMSRHGGSEEAVVEVQVRDDDDDGDDDASGHPAGGGRRENWVIVRESYLEGKIDRIGG